MQEILPLYGLFQKLQREEQFYLGIDDYELLLKALQSGFGLQSKEDLLFLCKKLWLKSLDKEASFEKYFSECIRIEIANTNLITEPTTRPEPDEVTSKKEIKQPKDADQAIQEDITKPELGNEPKDRPILSEERLNEYLSVILQSVDEEGDDFASFSNKAQAELGDSIHKHFMLTGKYLAIKERPLLQSLQSLRKKKTVVESENEIDIDRTLQQYYNTGSLSKFIYQNKPVFNTKLIMLTDLADSMVAFANHTVIFEEQVSNSTNLNHLSYYFKQYPKEQLFADKAYLQVEQRERIFTKKPGEELLVVIFSDAGAAIRLYKWEHVYKTYLFLNHLFKAGCQVVWINPVPEYRWEGTNAKDIQRAVPMFEMNDTGLKSALLQLKGNRVSN